MRGEPEDQSKHGKLIDGHTGKAELQHEIMNVCGLSLKDNIQTESEVHVIDAMYVVNTIVPKPSWIETGEDLANEFLKRVDKLMTMFGSFICSVY